MELLQVDTLAQAREKLLHHAAGWVIQSQTLPFAQALGRTLAQDIYANEAVPGFPRSTVDGYAVLAADTAAAGDAIPVFLQLVGSVEMGRAAEKSLAAGQCIEVPTGGMLPPGADAVVMVEYTEPFGDGVAVGVSVARGENTVLPGEDMVPGQLLFSRSTVLAPQHIGALAGAGITQVPVYSQPAIAVISTGDEIQPPHAPLSPGQVHDINSAALAAQAAKTGYTVRQSVLLPDEEALLLQTVKDAMQSCDVVLVSGGSSQGKKDVTAKVLAQAAAPGVFTHGLALKPGKPTILAHDSASQTLLCGLPGHPVSALMVFELLFGWLLRSKTGAPAPQTIPAKISENLAGAPGKLCCVPVRLAGDCGHWQAQPVFGKSGLITTLCRADGYFLIAQNKEGILQGETVQVTLL